MNASIKRIGPEPPKLERNYKKRPCQVTGEGKYIKVLPSEYRPRPAPIPKLRKRKPRAEEEHVEKVKEAVVRHKGFYLVAAGGAGALLSHSIIKREPVAFEDLLSEAVTRITVKDFPCFVGIDCRGDDIYDLKEDDE